MTRIPRTPLVSQSHPRLKRRLVYIREGKGFWWYHLLAMLQPSRLGALETQPAVRGDAVSAFIQPAAKESERIEDPRRNLAEVYALTSPRKEGSGVPRCSARGKRKNRGKGVRCARNDSGLPFCARRAPLRVVRARPELFPLQRGHCAPNGGFECTSTCSDFIDHL